MDRLAQIRTLTLGLLLGLLSSMASGQRDAVLGAGGELYEVKAGAYGGLFPGGREHAAGTPVLVLEVTRPGEETERSLVPWTADLHTEGSPSLIFEDASKTLFLVCETRINSIHSILRLSSYEGSGGWSTPIEIEKNPTSLKTSPQLAITRDSYVETGAEGQSIVRHRTLLHTIWAEEYGSSGAYKTFYMPLLLEDGQYVGSDSLFDLSQFDIAPAVPGFQSHGLARNPVIQRGRDGRTVVVAFTSAESGRLAVVEIDSLPAELSLLADGARAQIIDLGARRSYPANLPAMASEVRERVIAIGGAFHAEVVESIADMVYGMVVRNGGTKALVPLAGEARAQIIDLGAKLSGRGLRMSHNASTSVVETVNSSSEEAETLPSHLVQFRVASTRPAPDTSNKDLRLFVSESGDNVLVSWIEKDRLFYRMSEGDGWTDILQLRISAGLDARRAYEILEQRVRNR
jgi:hypothetical protein